MIETRNPIFIKEIFLKNYRTYRDLSIKFTQNIHTLVGPNECGKTNLLYSFDLFTNPNLLQKSDVCCFVDEIFDTESEIIFKFDLNNFSQFSNKKIDDLIIKYHGKNRTLSIPGKEIKINKIIYLISITSQPLSSGQIHFTLDELVKLMNLPANHHLEPNKEYTFNISSSLLLKKIEKYISDHQNKDSIELKVNEETNEVIDELKVDALIKEIKFVNWTFKEEYYIPDVIPLGNLQSQPQKYESINNFFEIIIDIKDKIKFDCLIKDKEYNFSHIVPIIFQLHKKSYYVIIFPDKVTQTILNNFILLEEIVIKKKKGIPMFIIKENLNDFGGISEKYCIPLDEDKILEFLKIE